MQIEDGLIWVYGVGEDGVQAFTDFGIENLEFVGLQGKPQAAHALATGMIIRIASHIDAPGRDQLPHLFCSWPELRRRPGAEMAGVSERPASSAGTSHVIGVL
ncbi:hypothetical protein [Bradyrhizobium elkanii]|uniref:hypothetical protein n=1 Tax=Bradyrhizobium elkanii TaxID=29448 RepID=UPI003A870E1C